MNSHIYKLQLADGEPWSLSAHSDLQKWLYDFSSALSLSEGEPPSDHSIYFHLYTGKQLEIDRSEVETEFCREWNRIYCCEAPPVHLFHDNRLHRNIVTVNTSFFHSRDMYYLNMAKAMLPFFLHSINHGGIPLHAALAEHSGAGVLIAAGGDVGKTTCCRRMPERSWTAHCDDLVLLVRNPEGELFAHPMPTWSDYTIRGETDHKWAFEKALPVKAICFLKQSSEDAVTPLQKIDSTILLLNSVQQVWNLNSISSLLLRRNINSAVFENISQIAEKSPAYTLEATLDGEFWQSIIEVL